MTPNDDQPPAVTRGRLARLRVIGRVIASPAFASDDFRRLWIASALNAAGFSGEQLILGLLVFRILAIHFALVIVKFTFVSNAIRVGRNKAVHRCFLVCFQHATRPDGRAKWIPYFRI